MTAIAEVAVKDASLDRFVERRRCRRFAIFYGTATRCLEK